MGKIDLGPGRGFHKVKAGETVYKGEVSVEGKFGSLRKRNILLGCQWGRQGRPKTRAGRGLRPVWLRPHLG